MNDTTSQILQQRKMIRADTFHTKVKLMKENMSKKHFEKKTKPSLISHKESSKTEITG